MTTNWSTYFTRNPPPPLESGETRIYLLDEEDLFSSPNDESFRFLSLEERHRYEKIQHRGSRSEFLAGRWLAKSIVSGMFDVPIDLVSFEATDRGKLVWNRSSASKSLHFNLSHSGGAVALACSSTSEVGIDIEDSFRRIDSFLEIAERFFSAEEYRWVLANPQASWNRFLRIFVQKEAVLKSNGLGLSDRLDLVTTVLDDEDFSSDERTLFRCGTSGRLFACARSISKTEVWNVHSLEFNSIKETETSSSCVTA